MSTVTYIAVWLTLLSSGLIHASEPLAQDKKTIDRALKFGIEALHSGKLVQAQIEFERAVREYPDNAEAYLQLGILLGQMGHTQEASSTFQKALRLNPNSAEAHYNLGLTKIADPSDKLDWLGAIAEFRRALQLRPDYAEAHHALGAGLVETGSIAAAISEFREAVSINTHLPENHLDLGKALAQAGQQQAALDEYKEAVRLRPGYAEAEVAWAKLLAAMDRDAAVVQGEIIDHFQRALRNNPDNLTAQYGLAQALKRQGNAKEAEFALREAQSLTTQRQEKVRCMRLSNEGLDAAHRGDRDMAVRRLREAVELRPDVALAHYNLGLVLADSGDLAGGIAQVIQAVSLAPSEGHFYLSLGRMWSQQGNVAKARAAFKRASDVDPNDTVARTHLQQASAADQTGAVDGPYEYGAPADTPDQHFAFATVLARQGDWIGAMGEWLRVLALQPNHLEARNNLAVCYSHVGQNFKAELEFRKALQVSADSPDAHFGLAILALERKNNSVAVEELQHVIRVNPSYPNAQKLLSLSSVPSK